MNRTRKLLAACAVALAAPVAITGCGGEDPEDVIREGITSFPELESGVLAAEFSGTVEGAGGGDVSASLSGPFDITEGEVAQFDLDGEFTANSPALALFAGSDTLQFEFGLASVVDQFFVGANRVEYVLDDRRSDQVALALTRDPRGTAGEDSETQSDESLESFSDLENEGTEEIDGVATTHVSGSVNTEELPEENDADFPLATPPPVGEAQVDFYFGEEDGILRRAELSTALDEIPELSESGVTGGDLNFSINVSSVNEEQSFTAPQDARPFAQLENQAARLLQQLGLDPAVLESILSGQLVVPDDEGGNGAQGTTPDPEIQDCVAEAQGPDEVAECLSQ